jgi:hypothetical protein
MSSLSATNPLTAKAYELEKGAYLRALQKARKKILYQKQRCKRDVFSKFI